MLQGKFRKRPVEVEAIEWTGENVQDVRTFAGEKAADLEQIGFYLVVVTLEGQMLANPGDMIIRGVAGELYPCKPEIFARTYEVV